MYMGDALSVPFTVSYFHTFEGGDMSERWGGGGRGGGLIIGCIFCSLVDGPLPGETLLQVAV